MKPLLFTPSLATTPLQNNDVTNEHFCKDIYYYQLFNNPFFSLHNTANCMQMLFFFMIVMWVRYQQRLARKGVETARLSSILLPVHLYTYYFICTTCVLLNVVLPIINYALENNPNVPIFQKGSTAENIFIGVIYGFEHAVLEGLVIMLLQSSMGTRAFKITGAIAIVWGCVVFAVSYILSFIQPGTTFDFYVHVSFYGVVFIFYLICWLVPYGWLYRRPALIGYAIFWSVTRCIVVVSEVLEYYQYDFGICFETLGFDVLFTMAVPFVMYITLRQDSQFWQGTLTEEWMTGGMSSIRGPLLGTSLRRESATEVALGLDSLRHGGKVETLNFAYLNVPEGSILGHGGSSRVYKGKYKGQDVAVKMLFCIDLTKDVVRRFFKEIKIHSGLRHSTVVKVKGVCVIPPAICLVMECMDCSLYDCLHSTEGKKFNMNQRLKISIECAKAIAFLHTLNPYVLHGDVKSMNFLVHHPNDFDKIKVKISDLGCSRREASGVYTGGGGNDNNYRRSSGAYSGFTVLWGAPEVTHNGIHSLGSDVYSLGIVLYEVLTGRVPFDEFDHLSNELLSDEIKKGLRPSLPEELPEELKLLLTKMWSSRLERPSATYVLEELVKFSVLLSP